MSDDIEFLSNVRALAENGTLAEVLRRVEEDQVKAWKAAPDLSKREECWHVLQGITMLRAKIESLNNEDKMLAHRMARVARRI
jgi:hypothetical protein